MGYIPWECIDLVITQQEKCLNDESNDFSIKNII